MVSAMTDASPSSTDKNNSKYINQDFRCDCAVMIFAQQDSD